MQKPNSKISYRYFALHIGAIIATFRLDDFAKDSGKFACSLLDNIGADYILRQLNYCIDTTAIGYGAWLLPLFLFLVEVFSSSSILTRHNTTSIDNLKAIDITSFLRMKKHLSLIPLFTLAIFGWPVDITKDEPFQIICTIDEDTDHAYEETWHIDPKSKKAFFEYIDDNSGLEGVEYSIIKMTPKEIQLSDGWGRFHYGGSSYSDYQKRNVVSINRVTGSVKYQEFIWPDKDSRPAGGMGTEKPIEFTYACKKPTRK